MEMERLLNQEDSELWSGFYSYRYEKKRAGNGPREVHLPLIVTEVGGSTDEGPTGRTGLGPRKVITVLHKRTCTVKYVVLRS